MLVLMTTHCKRRHTPPPLDNLILSGDIRNVRILATLEMSAVRTLSPLARETFPPRMILGWTIRFLLAMVRRVVGRIGLRRSATRAPADRLYATRPGLRR